MASLNQLVSEFAHAVGNPNSIPLRRNLRYAILHGRNELIRKSYENHKYVDKGLQQRIRVSIINVPEGEWIDFNDKKTEYLGGEKLPYKAPLNTIPIFVKKGSIIPMMPIMQYIGEKRDYPVTFHIFPNYEDEKASFTLYEDEGENQDYLKGIFSLTYIVCTTVSSGFNIDISPEDKGFHQSDKRNFVLSILTDKKPTSVSINGNAATLVPLEKLNIDNDFSQQWSWDENGKKLQVELI
jgi:alpha-glucosidase